MVLSNNLWLPSQRDKFQKCSFAEGNGRIGVLECVQIPVYG